MVQREKDEANLRFTETLTIPLRIEPKVRPPSGSGPKKPRSDPVHAAEPLETEEITAAAAATRSPAAKRCLRCRKRVGLIGFRCRCGDLFCGDHRYSDRHECGFDYKRLGKERIERENPVIRAAKIVII